MFEKVYYMLLKAKLKLFYSGSCMEELFMLQRVQRGHFAVVRRGKEFVYYDKVWRTLVTGKELLLLRRAVTVGHVCNPLFKPEDDQQVVANIH